MNNEQLMSLLRDVLRIGGTIATMLGVASGVVESVTSMVLTFGGPVLALIGVFFGWRSHSDTAKVEAASAMPEVKAMTITDPALATAARAVTGSAAVTSH